MDIALATSYSVEALVLVDIPDNGNDNTAESITPSIPHPAQSNGSSELRSVVFELLDIHEVSKLRIALPETPDGFGPTDLTKLRKNLRKLTDRGKGGKVTLSPLDPIEDMKVTGEGFLRLCKRIEALEAMLAKNPLSDESSMSESLRESYKMYVAKRDLENSIAALSQELENLKHVVLKEDLAKMMRVLRRLEYITPDNVILRKGKIACEITSSDQDELLLTELLFRGVFNDMECEMVVAVLSCLVNVHRTPDNFNPDEKFHDPLRLIYDVNQRIHAVTVEAGIASETASATGAEKIMPSLVELTYKWAKGHKFSDVIQGTDAYEGDIVRMMRRLEEVLRQLAGAARSPAVGSVELSEKFLEGITKIKRDIVFASSLYL